MAETSVDVIKRYLQDAIAAEKTFEMQLQEFAKESGNEAAKSAFHERALQTRNQHERLTTRLEALDSSRSATNNLITNIVGHRLKPAHVVHEKEQLTVQKLMIVYAVESSAVAMYEMIAALAEAAGDSDTEALARSIQTEEKETAEKIWSLLSVLIPSGTIAT